MEKEAETQAKTTRIQMELPPTSYNRLIALKEKTEAASYAEVLKNALRLYESLIDRHEGGARLYIKNPDGTMAEYVIFA